MYRQIIILRFRGLTNANLVDQKKLSKLKYCKKFMPHIDQKYIDALKNGDRILMKEIYDIYSKQCRNFVVKNGGSVDEANDIFQESLVSIILRAKSSDIVLEVPFGGFLYVIYKRRWIKWVNKNSKTSSNSIIDVADNTDDMQESNELKYSIFKWGFAQLSDDCKNLFKMRFDKMSSKDIALKLEVAPNNVDQKFYSCRERLRKKAEKHPDYQQV